MIRNVLSKCVVSLFILATLSGCVANTEYRTSLEPCNTAQKQSVCTKSAIEETDKYMLGFVEFDDQGSFWDRQQMRKIIDKLQGEEVLKTGLLMIVYVHGWQHNAEYNDENVASFRESLNLIHDFEQVASEKEKRPARKVAGIYVGWRGRSVDVWGLKNTTFWDRKNTADKVGHGALTNLLVELESVQISQVDVYDKQTKLIVIGHSFGGEMVYSALSQILVDRFVGEKGETPQTFGDLIILVNPAFEAARFTTLRDMERERKWYPNGQLPIVAIFTSKTDYATKYAFPAGRWFSTIFEKYRDGGLRQKEANRAAIGHFEPYITHDLRKAGDDAGTPDNRPVLRADFKQYATDAETFKALRKQWGEVNNADKNKGWTLAFKGFQLQQRGENSQPLNPLYVVSVDKEIINGHGDIWNPVFADFLRQFIMFTTIVKED